MTENEFCRETTKMEQKLSLEGYLKKDSMMCTIRYYMYILGTNMYL